MSHHEHWVCDNCTYKNFATQFCELCYKEQQQNDADTSVAGKDANTTETNSPYNKVFNHFMKFCEGTYADLTDKNIIKTSNWHKLNKAEVINCALLSKWIYDPQHFGPLLKHIGIANTKKSVGHQTAQWSLILNETSKTLYIVFKGTGTTGGETLGIDILTDISIIPTPIWCEDDNKNNENDSFHESKFDFAVHSGMYAAVQRNYRTIMKMIWEYRHKFNKLYITGHSLGGGLCILFGLELILKKHAIISQSKVIVFGAPNVISLETSNLRMHNASSQVVLTCLHTMTYCFVNRFDVVPRIPSEWILSILLPALPDMYTSDGFYSYIKSVGIKWFAPSYLEIVKQCFIEHKEILNTFKPFGTYIILLHDKDKNGFVINDSVNGDIIKILLSFIPPIIDINEEDSILAHLGYQITLKKTFRWTPDSEAQKCSLCLDDFSFTNRKHHCRHCGGVVCALCSGRKLLNDDGVLERACLKCYLCDQERISDGDQKRDNDERRKSFSNIESIQQKLLKQKSIVFEDGLWRVSSDDDGYKQLYGLLFESRDWTQLLCDHYMDYYLDGIVHIDSKSKDLSNSLHTKMLYIKLFENGKSCGDGSKFWNDVQSYIYDKSDVYGVLKLQSHKWPNKVISGFRSLYGHNDEHRIILKSKIFTCDKWKELYHSNSLNQLKNKWTETQIIMRLYE